MPTKLERERGKGSIILVVGTLVKELVLRLPLPWDNIVQDLSLRVRVRGAADLNDRKETEACHHQKKGSGIRISK